MGFFDMLVDIVGFFAAVGVMLGAAVLIWAWAMEAFGCAKERRSKAKFYDAKAVVELSKVVQTMEGK